MKTVALLAYYYPPLTGVAAERSAAMARHLGASGWRPIVVTPKSGHFHRAPASSPEVRVDRTRSVELSRLLRSGYGSATGTGLDRDDRTVTPLRTGPLGGFFRRAVREYLYVPDAQVGWIPFATSALGRIAEEPGQTLALLSSSVPYSAHLAARSVARRHDLPWVAEFRDPWTTCHPSLRPRSRARRTLDRRLEAEILRAADAVVVTSEATREGILDAHRDLPADRVHVVYNGFEPLAEASAAPRAEHPMRVLYAGSVAPGVSVGPILGAVAAVAAAEPGSIVLQILGPDEPWSSGAAEHPDSARWLSHGGTVSASEARSAMAAASVNLLLLPGEAHRDRLPGKLFEYIGARRPILAVVPSDSEMRTVAARYGSTRFAADNRATELEAALRDLLEEHREGTLLQRVAEDGAAAELTRAAQARRMADVLAEATDRRAHA